MFYYKIIVAYDGTVYHGWQSQPYATTVSGVLQSTFEKVFNCKAFILGASRTDAGVHSLGQVAIVRTELDISEKKLENAWNNALPSDILIRDISKIDELVHPHAGVVQKTYWYHLFLERPLPFVQRYGWFLKRGFKVNKLQEALAVFIGTHDFRSFCTGNEAESTVRTVDSISIEYIQEFNAYRVVIKGKGFLRYMVRRIVGAALEVATNPDLSVNDLRSRLLLKDPEHTLPNAPAKGLVLYEILYDKGGVK